MADWNVWGGYSQCIGKLCDNCGRINLRVSHNIFTHQLGKRNIGYKRCGRYAVKWWRWSSSDGMIDENDIRVAVKTRDADVIVVYVGR